MKRTDVITLANNLALNRDAAVSGTPAGLDVTRLANDHVSWLAAMTTDRQASYTSTAAAFSIASGGFSSRIDATNILKVLSVTREASTSTIDGVDLEVVSPGEIYHLRRKSTTAGTVRYVALVRLAGASNRFRAIVHPPASGTTSLALHYLPFANEFTTSPLDDAETMDVPQHAQYRIVREVAVDISIILRRTPQQIASIMQAVPREEALTDGMLARNLEPGYPTELPI